MANLDERSRYLRTLVLRGVEETKKGHIASSLSLVEIIRVLYDDIMRYKVEDPKWRGRDRFILSKGHGCLMLYAILADKGFIAIDELRTYTMAGSRLGGNPEIIIPGVEASSGSLGHGLSIGVGMALAARFEKRDSRVYVVMGDGEINEGSVWEAALAASKYKLSNLCAIIDYNKLQIGGSVEELTGLEPLNDKWKSFGFSVIEVDGHDVDLLRETFKSLPLEKDRPTVLICHTTKGKGVNFMENDYKWHWKSGIDKEMFSKLLNEVEGK